MCDAKIRASPLKTSRAPVSVKFEARYSRGKYLSADQLYFIDFTTSYRSGTLATMTNFADVHYKNIAFLVRNINGDVRR